jgi:hypothetical protein
MHLAVATGTPVVAVLLAEDGVRWSHPARFAGVQAAVGAPDEVERALQAAKRLLTS